MLPMLLTLAFEPGFGTPPPRFEAPEEDCAVYGAILHEKFGSWGGFHGPRARVARPAPDTGELATYDISCSGLVAHDDAAPTRVILFDEPVYDRHAGTATVGYSVLGYNHHWNVDLVTSREVHACRLDRDVGGWKVADCRLVLSTDD